MIVILTIFLARVIAHSRLFARRMRHTQAELEQQLYASAHHLTNHIEVAKDQLTSVLENGESAFASDIVEAEQAIDVLTEQLEAFRRSYKHYAWSKKHRTLYMKCRAYDNSLARAINRLAVAHPTVQPSAAALRPTYRHHFGW